MPIHRTRGPKRLPAALLPPVSFTTGEAAAICGLKTRTLTRWVDSGLLPGYCVPGNHTRRILRSDLIAFMRRHGFPLPDEFRAAIEILVCGLAAHEQVTGGRTVAGLFELGALVALHPPATVVLGDEDGVTAALGAVRSVLTLRPGTPVHLVVSEDCSAPDVPEGVTVHRRPVAWPLLIGAGKAL